MAQKRIIKCINCGDFNENRDYCKNCGATLSYKKRREKKQNIERKKRIEIVKKEPPNFIDKLRHHKSRPYRILGMIFYSGFAVVSAIGAFLAWLIFAIAAG